MIFGVCDILDGTIARLLQTSQKIGAYLDLISDRMVEAAIIVGFTVLYPQYYFTYIIFFIAVLLHFSTFVVAATLWPNMGQKSMHYDASVIERAEAFVVFALMLLFPQYIQTILMPFNIAIILTGLSRFFRVLSFAKTVDNQE